jgi:dolichol-phosphate mannosyltransferase
VSVDLSVVVPVFNEVSGIEAAISRLRGVLDGLDLASYELVCVDDGSTDGSGECLDRLCASDQRVRVVHFTRNFGKEAALQAGLEATRGDAAIFMDADLQHPPELIPQLVELWRDGGYDVVEARKRSRGDEGLLYRGLAWLFNGLMSRATGAGMHGASDYKLLARPALDALAQLPERHRFFRGLVHWIGFEHTSVEFDVDPRESGQPSFRPIDLLRYAFDGFLSFSTLPLVMIATAGVATTAFGALLGAVALWHFATGVAMSGFTTVILLQVIFSGLILASLGTIALYLGRLFEEVKGRPLYLVRASDKEELPDVRAGERDG